MSQLDSHVRSLRNRLTLGLFLDALGWALMAVAGVCLIALTLSRLGAFQPPSPLWGLLGLCAASFIGAGIHAVWRAPSDHQAAVRIDAALGLKEKFSTALLARGSSDPFAAASVADAEHTANNVSLRRRFPLAFPRMGYWALGLAVAAVLVQLLVPPMDLFGRKQRQAAAAARQQQVDEARKKVQKALVELNSLPRVEASDPKLQAARAELQALLNKPIRDPAAAATTAQKAVQDAQALRDRIKDNQKAVDSEAQKKMFRNMLTSNQPFSQLEDARKKLASADWNSAAQAMQQAMDKFDAADLPDRKEMEKEMGAMAQMLKAMASDPRAQKEIAENLSKMGARPEQAKDLINEMERAAAGDKEAAERLKNMAENLARQNNGGKLPAPEELAKLMQQVQAMQGQMNAQQQAQAMAQAAQAMQQAMQQANQAKNNNTQPSPQQAMAQAQQAMKDALNQMQQAQQDAQQMAAAQGAGGKDPGKGQGQWGDQNADGQANANGQANAEGQGMGPGGVGRGAGQRPETPAPFDTKAEHAPGVTDEKGKVLAGWFVKADSIKGESREQLKQVLTAAEQQQTDEIEQDRIPLSSQKVVRDYFNSMKQDAERPQ